MAALDLLLDDTREMLREAVQRLLADTTEPDWSDLSDKLGLAGLTVPESAGGFGGGVADVALVMAELGNAPHSGLIAAEWLAHAAACHALSAAAPAHPLLDALALGQDRAALVVLPALGPTGSALLVPGAAHADVLVLTDGRDVAVCSPDAPGVERRERTWHDGTVAADLHFSGLCAQPVGTLSGTAPADVLRAGACAEAVGLMARMLADTAAWLGDRRQFGAPIGSFQALRHRLADMQMAAMQAQGLTERAVLALECGDDDAPAALAAACVMVRDAARDVGEGAVQLHGAMGLTEELRLGARFKRLLAIAAAFGGEAAVLGRFMAVAA
ncbi:MAG: hypothetical protein RIS85_2578 [Pseudomonadota bacterium]